MKRLEQRRVLPLILPLLLSTGASAEERPKVRVQHILIVVLKPWLLRGSRQVARWHIALVWLMDWKKSSTWRSMTRWWMLNPIRREMNTVSDSIRYLSHVQIICWGRKRGNYHSRSAWQASYLIHIIKTAKPGHMPDNSLKRWMSASGQKRSLIY